MRGTQFIVENWNQHCVKCGSGKRNVIIAFGEIRWSLWRRISSVKTDLFFFCIFAVLLASFLTSVSLNSDKILLNCNSIWHLLSVPFLISQTCLSLLFDLLLLTIIPNFVLLSSYQSWSVINKLCRLQNLIKRTVSFSLSHLSWA